MSYEVTVGKIKKVDKRILDCLRMNPDWNYFKLAEKMLFSCQRKKERNELIRSGFEYNLLDCLVPYLIETDTIRGLEQPLLELDYDNFHQYFSNNIDDFKNHNIKCIWNGSNWVHNCSDCKSSTEMIRNHNPCNLEHP